MKNNNNSEIEELEIKAPYYQCGIYAITINPSDSLQKVTSVAYNEFTDSLVHKTSTTLKRYITISSKLVPILANYKYKLWWDVSCPTDIYKGKFPRLHLHGVIYLTDYMLVEEFLLKTSYILSEFNSIKLVKIEGEKNLDKWLRYCRKYQNIIKRSPLENKF